MSTPLLSLPNELLLIISSFLSHHRQLYAMARSCRRLYYLLRQNLLRCNVRHSKGSALIWAAKRDRRNLVRRLLRLGAPINTRGEPQHSGTPLHYAAKAGHLGMVELLLRKGADSESCGLKGHKPLLLALWAKNEEIAIALFRNSSNPNCQIAGDAGYTPLHAACYRQLTSCARLFLESGADVHARTLNGYTPLHLALVPEASIQSCTLELVMLLLDSGSRKDTKALEFGLRHPYPQVRNFFLEHKNNECSTSTSEEADDMIFEPEDLLDDKMFPPLRPLHTFCEQKPSISTWDLLRVKEIRQTLPVIKSTRAEEVHRPDDSTDAFPKLIGRNFPHPLEYDARLSWMDLRTRKTQPMVEKAYSQEDLRSQSGQVSKKKRWLPFQLS